MNRRRFQRIALPLLAVLFAVVAIQQIRGLVGHRHHDRVLHIDRTHSDHGHRHAHRHERRHRHHERRDVIVRID